MQYAIVVDILEKFNVKNCALLFTVYYQAIQSLGKSVVTLIRYSSCSY